MRSRRLVGLAFAVALVAATHGVAAQDVGDSESVSPQRDAQHGPTVVVSTLAIDAVASSATQTIQTNIGNDALSMSSLSVDTIMDSANGNGGVLFVNAAAGNGNNQGSSASFAVSRNASTAYTTASSTVGQYLVANVMSANNQTQHAEISGSLSDSSGTVGVNQVTGNGNNQANALAVALGFAPAGGLILAEADLEQVSASNTVAESAMSRSAAIVNSGNRSNGMVSVNQASGNLISQANVVVFAASESFRKP